MKFEGLYRLALMMPLLAPAMGEASLVSRMGSLYLYDPITFDAGILQRGTNVRGGLGSDRGEIETSIDLPFYQEFSLQLGYHQNIRLNAPDANEFIWRFRMPVIEVPRYAHIASYQFYYLGSTSLGPEENAAIPRHEFGGAYSMGQGTRLGYGSLHVQGGFAFRNESQARLETLEDDGTAGSRFGIALRAAMLGQIYEPGPGPSGQWTVSISPIEVTYLHYGLQAKDGGMTDFQLAFLGASVHFTPKLATYSLSIIPRWRVHTAPDGVTDSWGFLANFAVTYRTFLE